MHNTFQYDHFRYWVRVKKSQNKNTLSDFILPLQMHVQNHEREQKFCFYPFRKKLKENPVVWTRLTWLWQISTVQIAHNEWAWAIFVAITKGHLYTAIIGSTLMTYVEYLLKSYCFCWCQCTSTILQVLDCLVEHWKKLFWSFQREQHLVKH